MGEDYPSTTGFGYSGDSKLCARVDISKADQVNEIELDDEVTIVIKGKVKRLEGPEQFKSTEYKNGKEKEVNRKHPGHIEVEIISMKVSADNEFEGLLEDE